jgi:hypothetical protein
MVTPRQLRDWASRIHAGNLDDLCDAAEEMRKAADELAGKNAPDPRLEGVPEIRSGVYGYPPHPQFVSALKWPTEEWKGSWYVLGPASELLDVDQAEVHRLNDHSVTVIPGEVVGWRVVVKKFTLSKHEIDVRPVLYVLTTFDRVYDDADDSISEWTLG